MRWLVLFFVMYFVCFVMVLLHLLVLCGLYIFLSTYNVSFVPIGLTFMAYFKQGSQVWAESPTGRCNVMQ
jgi:hypothetical protein